MTHEHGRHTRKAGLVISKGMQRQRVLDQKRRRLENRIKRTRTKIQRLTDSYVAFAVAMKREVTPLENRCREVEDEIHELFAEIFRTRKFGKRSKRQIERVYEELHKAGFLSFRDHEPFPEHEPDEPDEPGAQEPDAQEQERAPSWRETARERSRDMRDLFLRLAGIFHPDRAGDPDREREHTEIMKKLNRAYREGDAAALLAMERELVERAVRTPAHTTPDTMTDATADATADAIGARCALLESRIRLLEQQLEQLRSTLRELERDDLAVVIACAAEAGRLGGMDPIEAIVADGTRALEILQQLRDFTRQFRDRKMTIAAFVRGPDLFHDEDVAYMDDEDVLNSIMDEFLFMVRDAPEAEAPRPRRKRKRKSR